MRLAINPIRSLLKGFLEEADLYVSYSHDSASVLDSRQDCLPGDEYSAAESDERNETEPSLCNVVSPQVLPGDGRAMSQRRTFKTCFLPSRANVCSSRTCCLEPLMPEYGPE